MNSRRRAGQAMVEAIVIVVAVELAAAVAFRVLTHAARVAATAQDRWDALPIP